MKNLCLCLICFMVVYGCGPEKKSEPQWQQLFNGKDLTGWDIKISGYELGDNFANTFRVENGLLKVGYDNYDKFNGEFGHIFYKEKYSDYILRVEYRIIGEQTPDAPGWAYKNSGAMLHAQSAKSMGIDQDFPVSIEAQFLGGNGKDKRPTANLCTPGTHVQIDGQLVTDHCINSKSETFHGEEWVTVEMVIRHDSIMHHIVNGDTVLTYSKPIISDDFMWGDTMIKEGTPLREGYITLQAESHPIEFRKVELLDLGN